MCEWNEESIEMDEETVGQSFAWGMEVHAAINSGLGDKHANNSMM